MPSSSWPRTLPAAHRVFLEHALPQLAADRRLVGVAAKGSFSIDQMDAFSDLDLLVAVEPDAEVRRSAAEAPAPRCLDRMQQVAAP